MEYLQRAVAWMVLAATANLVWLVATVRPLPLVIFLVFAGLALSVWFHVRPRLLLAHKLPRRSATLTDGYELLLAASVATVTNIVWWVLLGIDAAHRGTAQPWVVFGANLVVGILFIASLAINGFVRISLGSRQVTLTTKVMIALLWWLPPVTVVLLGRMSRTASAEIRTNAHRAARDQARAAQQICRTRHPLLLVHGVFFRDWPVFNYWGRIPEALIANGATISYGNQDASRTVADCGAQLVAAIEQAAAATGKVNIIAHSKGGLDSRWAISQLGMADKVASLTTINCSHRGCNFARELLEKIPEGTQAKIVKGADAVFGKLGDPNPDFMSSIADLTDVECARLNSLMPDAPGVTYLSVGSRMASRFAAPFPLNLGYTLIEPIDGPNDGLVAVHSMPWGEYLGTIEPTGKNGISHGDMIDLMRRDIDGFDVCEFYVNLVSGLRERGL